MNIIDAKRVWLHRLVLDPESGQFIPPLSLHTGLYTILTIPNPATNIVSLNSRLATAYINARIESAR